MLWSWDGNVSSSTFSERRHVLVLLFQLDVLPGYGRAIRKESGEGVLAEDHCSVMGRRHPHDLNPDIPRAKEPKKNRQQGQERKTKTAPTERLHQTQQQNTKD
jgi:hypothetical protein